MLALVCKRFTALLRLAAILGGMVAATFSGLAGEPIVLAKLVEAADQRHGFVAILAPAITKHCMRAVWGQTPPRLFRTWAETLLVDDLANRALVQKVELAKAEAVKPRRALFLSLEHVEPDDLEATAIYTSSRPQSRFGHDLTRVMDCQYKSMVAALLGADES